MGAYENALAEEGTREEILRECFKWKEDAYLRKERNIGLRRQIAELERHRDVLTSAFRMECRVFQAMIRFKCFFGFHGSCTNCGYERRP